jgi:hypothetical protein
MRAVEVQYAAAVSAVGSPATVYSLFIPRSTASLPDCTGT